MNVGMRQTANLQHRLVMTPKLQQAIQVLLMSRLDLKQHMSQQLEQNPLLEEISEEDELEEIIDLEEFDPDTQWNEPEEIIDREDKEPDFDWKDFLDDSFHRVKAESLNIGRTMRTSVPLISHVSSRCTIF